MNTRSEGAKPRRCPNAACEQWVARMEVFLQPLAVKNEGCKQERHDLPKSLRICRKFRQNLRPFGGGENGLVQVEVGGEGRKRLLSHTMLTYSYSAVKSMYMPPLHHPYTGRNPWKQHIFLVFFSLSIFQKKGSCLIFYEKSDMIDVSQGSATTSKLVLPTPFKEVSLLNAERPIFNFF